MGGSVYFSCNILVGKNNDLFIIDEMRDEFSLHGIPVSILSGLTLVGDESK